MQIIPPVFERELRVAARRRGTFWIRVAVAGVATLVGAWILVSMQFSYVRQPSDISQSLFATVSGLTALYCLIAGLLHTADCISHEKRAGTLGLLFLTDLKGYSVIFGKMLATSLNAFYALMAIFPVLAIPLLLGGIPPNVFWAMTAFLVNILFFSLSAGMLMSVLGQFELRTVAWTFVLILFFVGGIPLLGLIGADVWYRFHSARPVYEMFSHEPPEWTLWPSPVYGFFRLMNLMFSGGSVRGFWSSLVTIHASGWLCLALASARLPYSWQDRTTSRAQTKFRERFSRWKHGSQATRQFLRRTLLDVNAFSWLSGRNRLKRWLVWAVLGVTGLFWLWGWLKWPSDFSDQWVLVLIGLWLHTVLKIWTGVEACQRLAEDRQSGALELLLSTPLSVRHLLRGQWLALRRQFMWPILLVLALDLFIGLRFSSNDKEWLPTWLAGMVVLVADVVTIAWVGVWLGLRKQSATRALVGVVGRILVLPWLLYFFLLQVMSILSLRIGSLRWDFVALVTLWVVLGLLLDGFFMVTARHRLLTRFRDLAVQRADRRTHRWWWPFGKRVTPETAQLH